MPNQNNSSNSQLNNANSVTPVQGVGGEVITGQSNSQLQNNNINQLATQLIEALQQDGKGQNVQFLRTSSTGSTTNSQQSSINNGANSKSDYDYFDVEQQIVNEIQQIKQNADNYGDVVEIVGRRSRLVESESRGNGYEYEYLLSDGRIVTNDQCWELANAGKIKNVIGSHNHARKYVRSVGDGTTENNLGNLPTF